MASEDRGAWRPRLSAAAAHDLDDIVRVTVEHFGPKQAAQYRTTILQAIEAVRDGPDIAGSRRRDDILPGLRTLALARLGRSGRHILFYRAAADRVIDIGRILHDAMDWSRHLEEER